eukprot:6331568-Pyramimonas_sp.AAC.1
MASKRWMGKEQMEIVYGKKRVRVWLDSGKLDSRPDPVTGSTDEDMQDYKIREDAELEINSEDVKLGIQNKGDELSGDGVAELQQQFDDMTSSMLPQLGVPPQRMQEVKAEEPDDGSDPFEKLEIMKNTKESLRKLRDTELDAKLMKESSNGESYAAALSSDIANFLPKLSACIKAVEKLALTPKKEVLNFDDIQKLDSKVTSLMEKFSSMRGWAVKFGFIPASKKKRA